MRKTEHEPTYENVSICAISAVIILLLLLYSAAHGDKRYDSGYQEGYLDGKDAGYEIGYVNGKEDGYESGHSDGYEEGYEAGGDEGYGYGYDDGYTDGAKCTSGSESLSSEDETESSVATTYPSPIAAFSPTIIKEKSGSGEQESEVTYILNTNTGRFHNPDCTSVLEIFPENRVVSHNTREELIEQEYKPCQRCNP